MKAVIQRVSEARAEVSGRVTGSIGRGLLVLLGVEKGDGENDAAYMEKKIPRLRIFEDQEGKMNLSLSDVGGELLIVSQFTLAADTRRGNRPSFDSAEFPALAESRYQELVRGLRRGGITVATGEFGAFMKVHLVNDGPVTILLDSRQ